MSLDTDKRNGTDRRSGTNARSYSRPAGPRSRQSSPPPRPEPRRSLEEDLTRFAHAGLRLFRLRVARGRLRARRGLQRVVLGAAAAVVAAGTLVVAAAHVVRGAAGGIAAAAGGRPWVGDLGAGLLLVAVFFAGAICWTRRSNAAFVESKIREPATDLRRTES